MGRAMSNWDSLRRGVERQEQNFDHPDWEFCLPPIAEAVPDARHAAMRACLSAGASEDDCFALDLALGEALANAVMHGRSVTAPNMSADVCLRLWQFHGNLILEVRDYGPGFDPPPPPYSMPSDYEATHGRGLPLMQRLTDALLVSRGDTGTGGAAVYLVKSLTHSVSCAE
jgi:anti-sigma regulatory factor (Ser/Thr protein kinase)